MEFRLTVFLKSFQVQHVEDAFPVTAENDQVATLTLTSHFSVHDTDPRGGLRNSGLNLETMRGEDRCSPAPQSYWDFPAEMGFLLP